MTPPFVAARRFRLRTRSSRLRVRRARLSSRRQGLCSYRRLPASTSGTLSTAWFISSAPEAIRLIRPARPCLRSCQRPYAPLPSVSSGPDRQHPRASLRLYDTPGGSAPESLCSTRGGPTPREAKPRTRRHGGCADARGRSCARLASRGHAAIAASQPLIATLSGPPTTCQRSISFARCSRHSP